MAQRERYLAWPECRFIVRDPYQRDTAVADFTVIVAAPASIVFSTSLSRKRPFLYGRNFIDRIPASLCIAMLFLSVSGLILNLCSDPFYFQRFFTFPRETVQVFKASIGCHIRIN